MPTVTCFGEVLWDVFPNHKKVGGAPLNVALRLKSFGINSYIISRTGKDQNGEELIKYVLDNKLDISTIQIDKTFKTGVVNVMLDEMGSATYEIEYPVAWDKIEVNERSIDTVKESDAFIFGSLVCRDTISKRSLFTLLECAKFKVFDVNLRPPHYSIALLVELMGKADLIKCNDEELEEICTALSFESNDIQDQIEFLSKKTNTNKICITRGGNGAILFIDGRYYSNNGYKIKVGDTVGAGDSFLASLVFKFLSKEKFQESLDFASAVGSIVASKNGANPKVPPNDILEILEN